MTCVFRLGEIFLLPFAWAAIVLGSLQAKILASPSDHSDCSPWGSGAETAALLAMHPGSLAFIAPQSCF